MSAIGKSAPPYIHDLVHFTKDDKFDSWNVTFQKYKTEQLAEYDNYNIYFNKVVESLCALGNGQIGQRGQFEEKYSGVHLKGNYMTGCWYPDSTRVGWWKNGYPRYYPKMINCPDWTGIHVVFDEKDELDFNNEKLFKIEDFERVLHMKESFLERKAKIHYENKGSLMLQSTRFISMANKNIGALKYSLKSKDFKGKIAFTTYVDGDVHNEEHNWEHDKVWLMRKSEVIADDMKSGYVTVASKKVNLRYPKPDVFDEHCKNICVGMYNRLYVNGKEVAPKSADKKDKYIAVHYSVDINAGDEVVLEKYAVLAHSHVADEEIQTRSAKILHGEMNKNFETMMSEHAAAWKKIWDETDIVIDGDVKAQQGTRFCLFHVNASCRFDMENKHLKITPKGFTGEKYGTGDYWDVESFCVPYYLCTYDKEFSKNHVMIRYKHLPAAIENAKKLGFKDGAALYPMVSMGEECHNEWEITFEEIHRNGAIAKVIYDYVRYTGDKTFLPQYGLEILIALSKFWAQRATKSFQSKKYMILGVTGPNEFENNINNNWFTNTLAVWTLKYTQEVMDLVKKEYPEDFARLAPKWNQADIAQWNDIIANMYFPKSEEHGVWLQHDGFLDKELIRTENLLPSNRPLWRVWSWDRILRSCFIKQADTLQGLFYFEEDKQVLKKHFEFYEPFTVHESSLSACVHSCIAAKCGMLEKAYELFNVALRYSLDNYNFDTVDGAHVTCMAGALMMILHGFAGITPKGNGEFDFKDCTLCPGWKKLQFRFLQNGKPFLFTLTEEGHKVTAL